LTVTALVLAAIAATLALTGALYHDPAQNRDGSWQGRCVDWGIITGIGACIAAPGLELTLGLILAMVVISNAVHFIVRAKVRTLATKQAAPAETDRPTKPNIDA
jgi:hypothetical protein